MARPMMDIGTMKLFMEPIEVVVKVAESKHPPRSIKHFGFFNNLAGILHLHQMLSLHHGLTVSLEVNSQPCMT